MSAFTKPRLTRTVATVLAASLALAGCNKASDEVARAESGAPALPDLPATLPLASGAATPVAYAPGPSELPDVRAIPAVRTIAPDDAYAYADQAYGFADALGAAPPDYAFDYDGVDPWAWQGYDDSIAFAEPIDGGYRYYYYRPGADTPYFIRDPRYGYGYDDGQLAVVYAADGAVVPYESYGPQIGYASRYWVRGRDLWQASRTQRRRPVIAANWARRQPVIAESRTRWFAVRPHQADWIRYHQRIAPRQQRHWQPEHIRREADARRYATWQGQGFRTAPPPRAIPVRWEKASWAKDPRRFAPAQAAVQRFAARDERPGQERARVSSGPRPHTVAAARRRDPGQALAARPLRAEGPRQMEGQARRRAAMQVVNTPPAKRVIDRAERRKTRRDRGVEPARQGRDQAGRRQARAEIRNTAREQHRANAISAPAERRQMQVERRPTRPVAAQPQRQAQPQRHAQPERQVQVQRPAQIQRQPRPQSAARPQGGRSDHAGGNPGGGGHGGGPHGGGGRQRP